MSTKAPRRVLIVEDDQEVRESLVQIVEDAGYVVECAANGAEALALLHSGAPMPGVILLDLMMPIMDGIELGTQLQGEAATRDLPLVVMSAAGQLNAKLAKLSVQAILEKPISLDLLLETIERCCRQEGRGPSISPT